MRVGLHGVYRHRPLVGYLSPRTGEPSLLRGAPLGHLTAYRTDRPGKGPDMELWPRLLRREPHLAAVETFRHLKEERPLTTTRNVRKLLESREQFGEPL